MITELVGHEGFLQATNDPLNWEANRICGTWSPYSVWSAWSYRDLVSGIVKWRRKPEIKPEPMRYEFRDNVPVAGGLRRWLPVQWVGKVADVVVTEWGGVEPEQPGYRPCSRAEAEARPNDSEYKPVGFRNWQPMSEFTGCHPPYEFRIPLQPAEAVKVTSNGPHVLVRREYLQEWMDRARDAEKERDSALGSQKATAAALEVERKSRAVTLAILQNVRNEEARLRQALLQDATSMGSAMQSMQNIKNRVDRVLTETAGKESEG